MKKFIKWMRRHPNTCSFFINFLATVLGIVLTLGTTMWYDRHEKAEASETLVENCLANMEERLADLDHVIEFYKLHDSVFQVMNTTPLDSLDEDELNDMLNIISIQNHLVTNLACEKLFSQSSSTLETLGGFSQVIGEGFEFLRYAEENHAAINAQKRELEHEMILSNNAYYAKGSMLDVMKTLVSDPRYFVFCDEYSEHVHSVRFAYKRLKKFLPAARRLWNKEITNDEFWTEVNNK